MRLRESIHHWLSRRVRVKRSLARALDGTQLVATRLAVCAAAPTGHARLRRCLRPDRGGTRAGRRARKPWIAGLGDQLSRLGPPITGIDGLPALTAQIPADEPAILLAHEPDIFPAVGDRFAVTIAGHTHAGQIKIAGRTPVVPSRFGSRYVYGHVVEDGRHLIVSAGLGTSMVPVRLGTRPEVVELVLGEGAATDREDDHDR